jgi:hypothetical protein
VADGGIIPPARSFLFFGPEEHGPFEERERVSLQRAEITETRTV